MWISRKKREQEKQQEREEGYKVGFNAGEDVGAKRGVALGRHLEKMEQDRMGCILGDFKLEDIING